MSMQPSSINGINGSTGGYLMAGKTAAEIAQLARGVPTEVDPGHQNVLKKWWNNLKNQFYAVQEGIDPSDLAQTGWGMILPFATDDAAKTRQAEILAALAPLRDLRRGQASRIKESYYREFVGPSAYRPNESKRDFLVRNHASPGSPADPEKLPYYLMIVGGPEEISYRFQYQLDVEYAVGRLWFETIAEYAQYARSVVLAETGTGAPGRTVRLFGVRNSDDPATQLSADHLIRPLTEIIRAKASHPESTTPWDVATVLAEEATKARLGQFLGGSETPAFLMTASHGMGFDNNDIRQIDHQGALLCQDWPGPLRSAPNRPISEDVYFAAQDVPDSAQLGGMVAFFFACYGAGTPKLDDFPDITIGNRAQIAPHSFLARLPQRMLGHPNGGALAVIGHVERAWGYSFQWPGAGEQLGAFQGMMTRLLSGYPIGAATEFLNQRYAALSVELGEALSEEKFGNIDEDNLAGLWISNNDARSYVIIGDPAVRVGGTRNPNRPVAGPGAIASFQTTELSMSSEPAPPAPEAPAPASTKPAPTPPAPLGTNPFADLPVIGRMPPAEAAARLRSVGENDLAATLEMPDGETPAQAPASPSVPFGLIDRIFNRAPRPWQNTAHAIGFLAKDDAAPSADPKPIAHASNIAADQSLKGASIKITLDDMRVVSYPGGGMHRVLFDFGAQNQAADKLEDLHFSATFRVQDGQQAGFVGQPVFVGLNVGNEGITFRCYTVNVKNDADQAFLDILDSDTFKSGLQLLTAAQPAIGPLSGMAVGLTRAVAGRTQNIPVQDLVLGLDFSTILTRARLAEGSYIAVQIPDSEHITWDWAQWVFHPSSGRVVSKDDPTAPIPYNYFIFSISRCETAPNSPPRS